MYDESFAAELARRLHRVNWSDLCNVAALGQDTLGWLGGHRAIIADMVLNAIGDETLLPLCERLDFMDKIVIWDDAYKNVRIRIHRFRAGYADRPHNHRFTFTTLILSGSYQHKIYDPSILIGPAAQPTEPIVIRTEAQGSGYTMDTNAVHSVTADHDTLSIMVRGPIERGSATIINPADGSRFVLRGAAERSRRENAALTLNPAAASEVAADAIGLITSADTVIRGGSGDDRVVDCHRVVLP